MCPPIESSRAERCCFARRPLFGCDFVRAHDVSLRLAVQFASTLLVCHRNRVRERLESVHSWLVYVIVHTKHHGAHCAQWHGNDILECVCFDFVQLFAANVCLSLWQLICSIYVVRDILSIFINTDDNHNDGQVSSRHSMRCVLSTLNSTAERTRLHTHSTNKNTKCHLIRYTQPQPQRIVVFYSVFRPKIAHKQFD